MSNISKIQFKKFTWHNLVANTETEIRYLRDNFQFTPQQLVDCTTPPLRPKVEFGPDYIFIVLLFPIYNRQTGLIASREIDIFLGRDFIVTVHNNEVQPLRDRTQPRSEPTSSLAFFLTLLEQLLLALYPMLNHVAWDTDTLDGQLFTGHERELINKILATKKNIVDIRKSMQGYRHVLSELESRHYAYFGSSKIEPSFAALIARSQDIWNQLENHMATIEAVRQTNESLISFRLSGIMKTLTIFSVLIFPLTLLAAIFGMDTKGGMPFLESEWGFWKVIGLMILLASLMLYYFKKHRWL